MKKIIIVALLTIGAAIGSRAQNTNTDTIPTAIRTAIATNFANADAMQWTVADSVYTGTFTLNGKRHIIDYSASGKTLRHRYQMNADAYPAAITALVKKDYPAYKIEDIDIIELNNVITYEAELEGKPDMVLNFDAEGKLLSARKE